MTIMNMHTEAGGDALLTGLNSEQKRAVITEGGPLLILAGAGSGKTRVITHRMAYLMQVRGVPAWRILAITFTNKAAAEMKERTAQLIGGADQMWIGTFHTMMLRILRQDCDRLGFAPGFSILDSDDQKRAIKEVLTELGLENTTIPLREIASRISFAKNEMISFARYQQEAKGNPYLMTIGRVYEAYAAYCKRHNGFDFDDILLYTLRLLEENDDLRERYQERFLHILVDEYQDTNKVQYELVRLLAAKHRNLAVVGDDDQSIYAFRGANIQNILDFEDDYPDATVIRLEQNYRSTQTILEAANHVIDKNEGRKRKRLWTSGDKGAPLTFYLASDQNDEASYVAGDIKRQLNRGATEACAVLYRASALSRSIEAALRDRQIPYAIFGGLRFYDRKEIKDVTAYLRLAANPADDLALGRIINEPKRGIGGQTMDNLRAIAREQNRSMFETARQAHRFGALQRSSGKLSAFVELIDNLRILLDSEDLSFSTFLEEVTRQSGLIRQLEAQVPSDMSAQTRIENIYEMVSDALEFEKKYLAGEIVAAWAAGEPLAAKTQPIDDSLRAIVQAYLEQAALYSDQDRQEDKPLVNLMTIHAAKGLEFDRVYLVGVEESIFPSSQTMDDADAVEEERRLCYVALTRAKKQLTVTAARNRLLYGKTQYNPPSRFLADIPEALVNALGGSMTRTTVPTRSAAAERYKTLSKLDSLRRNVSPPQAKRPAEANGIVWQQLKAGDIIQHERFGDGELIAVTPAGDNAILRVKFEVGERRFLSDSQELTLK